MPSQQDKNPSSRILLSRIHNFVALMRSDDIGGIMLLPNGTLRHSYLNIAKLKKSRIGYKLP
jgi:hypothetical protein